MSEPEPVNDAEAARPPLTAPAEAGPAEAPTNGQLLAEAEPSPESLQVTDTAVVESAPLPMVPIPSPSEAPTLATQLAEVLQQLTRLADMFDDKLRYDQVKEEIIDKLHAEVQQHRNDMMGRILLPVMRDLIQLHRAILTFVDARRAFPEEKRDWNNVLDNVATFGDDLIEVLARNGVESFSEDGAAFNPRTQRALRTLPTQEASLDRTVAQRLRPGFRCGQQLIQNEDVIVYKLQPAVTPTSGDRA